MSAPLFATQRSQVLEAYQKAGQPFNASTKPYKSTHQFVGTIVDPNLTLGIAYAVFKTGNANSVEWFDYGIGDEILFGAPPGIRRGLEDDTNLSLRRQTDGAEDFIIEGMSATARSTRFAYTAVPPATPPVDPDVVAAYLGNAVILDPAAIAIPPQVNSPFNLENTLMSALAPHIQIEFEWDRETVKKIGTLDQIPEGGAKSFLRSNGDPRTDDRFRIPEGFLWRRAGQPDSEFVVRGTLAEAVVVPINLVLRPGDATTFVAPRFVMLDITVRVHGLRVKLPTRN